MLAESVSSRLRKHGFRCRVVEISVRDNELFSFTRQHKIDHATNIMKEIAEEAYRIFKESYDWKKPIRSMGVRGADLVTDYFWEQIDLFSNMEFREKQMKADAAVDELRKRFGYFSVQRGLMYFDSSTLDNFSDYGVFKEVFALAIKDFTEKNKVKIPNGMHRYDLYISLWFCMKYYGRRVGDSKFICFDEGQDLAFNEYMK